MPSSYAHSSASIQNEPNSIGPPSPSLVAPEVNRDDEGLQVDPNGPYPFPTTKEVGSTSKHWLPWSYSAASSEKQLCRGQEGLIPVEEKTARNDKIWRFRRKPFIIITSICIVVAICAIVGGVVRSHRATKTAHAPTPTSITADPEDPDAADNPGVETEPVEAGTTGMAHLPCVSATVLPPSAPQATPRDIDNPYNSPVGARSSYDITCRRGVPGGEGSDGNAIINLRTFITYNFTACMDHCSEVKGCMGVVYSANLTDMVTDGDPGGNCLLKNSTWDPSAVRKYWLASAVRRGV